MSQKQVKKIRKKAQRDATNVAVGLGIQILNRIAQKPFKERAKVAWTILKGKRVM